MFLKNPVFTVLLIKSIVALVSRGDLKKHYKLLQQLFDI